MNKLSLIAASSILLAGASVRASDIYVDTFATSALAAGVTTSFNLWNPAVNSGDMDAGYYDVVASAHDVHSQFINHADSDGSGHYGIYNGYDDAAGMAYSVTLTGLTAGATYAFSADFLTLAPNPPYAQISNIEMRHDGSGISDFTLVPVPSGDEVWHKYSATFVATGTTDVLSIWNLAGASNSGNDFGLDHVAVSTVAVPLPASFAGSLAGLGALAVYKIRRRAR